MKQRRRLIQHDLAFRSTELRNPDGKWTKDVAGGVVKRLLDPPEHYSHFQAAHARLKADRSFAKATGEPDFESNPDAAFSTTGPARGWGMYQTQVYQKINNYLRTGEGGSIDVSPDPKTRKMGTTAEIAAEVNQAFDRWGYKTTKPMTLYRVVGGDSHKVSDLAPGTTYVEKGVSSTSESAGEVSGYLDGSKIKKPELIEIDVPIGTTLLGGYAQGIEIMLRPGTKFKVTGHYEADYGGQGTPHRMTKATIVEDETL